MVAELVAYLAQAVVQHPDRVTAKETQHPGRVEVLLKVAADDFGRIIGRNGQTIAAIRARAELAGKRQGRDVSVEAVDPAKSRPGEGSPSGDDSRVG
jgi:predicted RNA-binding protein YlqC (UPF0109 family)